MECIICLDKIEPNNLVNLKCANMFHTDCVIASSSSI